MQTERSVATLATAVTARSCRPSALTTRLAADTRCYKIQLLTDLRRGSAHAFYEACGMRPIAQGFRRYL